MYPQLVELMQKEKVDAIVIFSPAEITAFLGASASAPTGAALVACPSGATLLAPATADISGFSCAAKQYQDISFPARVYPALELERLLEQELSGVQRLGISKGASTNRPWFATKAQIVDLTYAVDTLMMYKPEVFLPAFKRASTLNQKGYESIRRNMRPGMTELDMRNLVETSYYTSSGIVPESGGDYLAGKRTTLIGSAPSSYAVQRGDCMILDIQVTFDGAGVDDCRTFFMGRPSDQMRAAYQAVIAALETGAKALSPGIKACDIYTIVNNTIVTQGYAPLPHHAGHGLGYRWNEAPYFVPEDSEHLRPGMVVTLEPAVYLENFGIRVENNYYITRTGAELITQTPYDIKWATIDG